MLTALIVAAIVGGATVLGSVFGLRFKNISKKSENAVLSFAAGVMLATAVFGLIVPSLENGEKYALAVTVCGFIIGVAVLSILGRITPYIENRVFGEIRHTDDRTVGKVILFVTAIAVHNLPEGIAAGVAVGTGDISEALVVAGGIALQNLPEGMVTVCPMLAVGFGVGKTMSIAVLTGVIEIIGCFIGYTAVVVSRTILPFALSFAGGTMFCVIIDEMIPETHKDGSGTVSTYSFAIGFVLMMMSDVLLG